MTKTEHIRKLIDEDPDISNVDLQKKTGASKQLVSQIAGNQEKRTGIKPKRGMHATGNTNPKNKPGVTTDLGTNTGTVEFRTNKHIKDIDQALREQKIDLTIWEVERVSTVDNAWDVTMKLGSEMGDRTVKHTNYQFKIKVFLKRRKEAPIISAIEGLITRIPKLIVPKAPKFKKMNGIAMAVAPLDAHMGKFAWAKETGRRDYNLKQAAKDYLEGVDTTLSWGSYFEPEQIYYIVGQDLMHIESFIPMTPKGHNVLDVDNRLPKIFGTAMDTVIESIRMCRTLAPTKVIWIPGNHDLHASLFLCMALKRIFADDSRIEVDDSPMQRKCIEWGRLLVGLAHGIVGRHQSWANELAQAFPEQWGRSTYREWWHGHKHKKQEVKTFPLVTQGGVLMRQLTALSPIDAWHFENLFTDAVPGSEAFLMDKRNGVFANFTAWTDIPPVRK